MTRLSVFLLFGPSSPRACRARAASAAAAIARVPMEAFAHASAPNSTLAACALAAGLSFAVPAHAERADRLQKINIAADESGQIDLQKQVVTYSGNVVIGRGTMVIRAARVEVRQLSTGYYTAVAFGAANKPATFRQKRDGVDEYIEGEAERLEYDGSRDLVKFINNAGLRRLRGAIPADEINGNLITYDATTEKMTVSGGAKSTPANPGGRVTAVLSPREGSEAALETAQAASAAASAPLKLSPALGSASAPPAPKEQR